MVQYSTLGKHLVVRNRQTQTLK